MTKTRIEMLEDMLEHERLGKLYLDQANFVNGLGNQSLAEYYVNKARYHAREYVNIKKELKGHFRTLVL